MSPTSSNDSKFKKTNHVFNNEIEIPVTNSSKLNDHAIFKSLNYKIAILKYKITGLSEKLVFNKSLEISKSMDIIKNSSESQLFLNSIKNYIMEDEDTESSSDDCYSQIENLNHGLSIEPSHRILSKYQAWLVERCQFQSKWSWLLSEIQSTEFRLKHLKKYSEEIKHLKRKYCSKNEINGDENSRSKYSRLEKRKRVQIHNLLSTDLIKFVSPLYSCDDNSSDKFVQCRCRLGDTGPCILCCGMKNKISDLHNDIFEKEDIWKASVLDNYIHTKISCINDVRNPMKRNVLFNGYVKSFGPHWSYPRARTSVSPILTAPAQPKIDLNKTEPLFLEFNGINIDNKEYKMDITNEYFPKVENDHLMDNSTNVKIEIKLPLWKKIDLPSTFNNDFIDKHFEIPILHHLCYQNVNAIENMKDEVFIKRHEFEEALERKRNYPLTKCVITQIDSFSKNPFFHGYEYKQNNEDAYDLRLFPLLSDEFKQLSQTTKCYQRSKRFKRKINKF